MTYASPMTTRRFPATLTAAAVLLLAGCDSSGDGADSVEPSLESAPGFHLPEAPDTPGLPSTRRGDAPAGWDGEHRGDTATGVAPGMRITVGPHGTECTLGPVLADGTAFTAGHCVAGADNDDRQAPVFDATGARIGELAGDRNLYLGGYGMFGGDAVAVTLDPGFLTDIGGVLPTGPVADPRELTTADTVCSWGASSGETCGNLTAADGVTFNYTAPSAGGDSGGPVYRVNDDGTVSPLGIITDGPVVGDRDSDFGGTLLDPAIRWADAGDAAWGRLRR